MTAFDRLSGALQFHIVNTLGWPSLRPVQELTIERVLDGKNAVVLAPTAGGKTEAAVFPLLSAMDREDWKPVSVIYLSPIKALLNNQEPRIEAYASLLGRRVFKWHGDVGAAARRRFLAEPADILLTTPESIEAMLMSAKVPARSLFEGLRAVVVDEIHAFADDDRGAHLSAILERLSRFSGSDFQRIGLSATVGNPDEILRWVRGSSERAGEIVRPPIPSREAELTIDWVGSIENAARVIAELHPGKKRLVFADARQRVERISKKLIEAGIDAYPIHGSLSLSEREFAERMSAEGRNCVIVATSAMELGIDIGDLDHVIQIDSPSTVAAFLQRMGRTGRREGTVSNCTFLCTETQGLLGAAALVQLFREGFVEQVRPLKRASHVLAHQVMALAVQQEGVARGDVFAWVEGASAFAELERSDVHDIIEHMEAEGILSSSGGRLWLGERGERIYGRRNFAELYAVFSTPRVIEVRWGGRVIGTLDGNFLSHLRLNQDRSAFTLAGRPWRVTAVDWRRGVCAVEPAEDAKAARWPGAPRFLGFELCQAMRRVLASDELDPSWSGRARDVLTELRAEHAFLKEGTAPMTELREGYRWWTFAGGRANTLLARTLETELGARCVVRNSSIDFTDNAGKSLAAIRNAIHAFAEAGRPSQADAERFAEGAVRERVSKFEPCLPDRLLKTLWSDAALDLDGAANAVVTAKTIDEPPPPPTLRDDEALEAELVPEKIAEALDERWVGASRTRNYMLNDPLLDWLALYGASAGFARDESDPRTDFGRFIMEKGRRFEEVVVAHLARLSTVQRVAEHHGDIVAPGKVMETLKAMREGVPILHQGVLHDEESETYGAPDLLFRSDELKRLFPEAIEDAEAATPASELGGDRHYVVVDVKYSTLELLKSGELGNQGSARAYKAQLYVYNRALGRLQGYLPPKAFLLGRSWRCRGERGSGALEKLAPVSQASRIDKHTSLGELVDDAVSWIRRVRRDGHRWQVLPQPSVEELRPNMGSTSDAPWRGAKKRIAEELEDLTLLWQVGVGKRNAACEAGLNRWRQDGCCAEALGVTGEKRAPILDAVLAINRPEVAEAVRPAHVRACEDVWRPVPPLEFYVDFETVSDLDDDFATFPQRGGQPLIFMIGCGHMEDGDWQFECFTADALNERSEAVIVEAWLEHMARAKTRLAPDNEEPLVFHWSHAEVSSLESAYNSAAARHSDNAWASPNWFDFLKRVVREEPVVVKGALGFGLKTIAKAMFLHGLIETSWKDGPTDGLGAMVGAWSASHEAAEKRCSLRDIELMREIERYNEVDCKVMMEIVRYLREKH